MSRLYQVNLRRVSSKSINLHQKHDNWLLFLQNKREEGKVAVGGGGAEKRRRKRKRVGEEEEKHSAPIKMSPEHNFLQLLSVSP